MHHFNLNFVAQRVADQDVFQIIDRIDAGVINQVQAFATFFLERRISCIILNAVGDGAYHSYAAVSFGLLKHIAMRVGATNAGSDRIIYRMFMIEHLSGQICHSADFIDGVGFDKDTVGHFVVLGLFLWCQILLVLAFTLGAAAGAMLAVVGVVAWCVCSGVCHDGIFQKKG